MHTQVWISVTAFLHFICQASKNSSDRSERIGTFFLTIGLWIGPEGEIITAILFAPVLLRDDLESQPPVSPLGRRNFLLYFIS